MLGRWRQRAWGSTPSGEEEPRPQDAEADAEPEPAPPPAPAPTVDELASILALVIVSDLNVEQIGERTGMSLTGTEAAIAMLQEQKTVLDSGGAYYRATQAGCPGPCRRQGHELRGQQVVIDAKTFRWICADCRDAGIYHE